MIYKYNKIWLAFVDIQALDGKKFNDLIEIENETFEEYAGAWGNILIQCELINEVPSIVEAGLKELGMRVRFIDKIENIGSLIEYDEIDKDLIEEINWLLSSEYVFKISDKLFPYSNHK